MQILYVPLINYFHVSFTKSVMNLSRKLNSALPSLNQMSTASRASNKKMTSPLILNTSTFSIIWKAHSGIA